MKNREQKQKSLETLAEQFKKANAAALVSFKKMTVAKDQELRRQLREAGVSYSVVKNTLARKAAAGIATAAAAADTPNVSSMSFTSCEASNSDSSLI